MLILSSVELCKQVQVSHCLILIEEVSFLSQIHKNTKTINLTFIYNISLHSVFVHFVE